jgi:uncharacterized membrane protein YccC
MPRRQRSKTHPEFINAAERRYDALTLKKQGQSYRMVAKTIIAKYGVENLPSTYDERYASRDVHDELRRLASLSQETAQELRQMELEKLEVAERAIWKQVQDGHHGAIDRWLRIAESRRKLLGLDMPLKVAPTDPKGDTPYVPHLDEFGEIIRRVQEYEQARKKDTSS